MEGTNAFVRCAAASVAVGAACWCVHLQIENSRLQLALSRLEKLDRSRMTCAQTRPLDLSVSDSDCRQRRSSIPVPRKLFGDHHEECSEV